MIGGLILATVATLFFVPLVFSVLHRKVPEPENRLAARPTPAPGILPGSVLT